MKDDDDTAECLLWAFKCYKRYSRFDDEKSKTDYVKDMTSSRERYRNNVWEDMYREDVILPEECEQTGNFALKHF